MGRNDTNEDKQSQLLTTNQPDRTKHGHVENLEQDFVYEVISFEYHPKKKFLLMLTFSSHVQIMRITNADAVVMGVSKFTISYYFLKPCSIICFEN